MESGDSKLVTVLTEHGPVKGDQRSSILGRNYYNFQGIPYMKAPVGKLRFRDPELPEKWTEPFDATNEAPSYIYVDFMGLQPSGQEDAGIINVFTPYINPQKPLAVMVWIHGGGFQMGSSKTDLYGPDYFMQKDVVFVSMNYRLGPIGFLSLNDPSLGVPGNAGLKDQNLALKWVQKNIANFGGDPNNVTLFGESAGAASTHYHMMSEKSKGLFHRAIPMSGTSFTKSWAFASKKDFASRLAVSLGWNKEGGERGLLEVLENSKAVDIVNETQNMLTDQETFGFHILFPFSPVVEPYITKNTFISKDPVTLGRQAWSNQIDCVFSGTSLEGGLMAFIPKMEKFAEILQNANYLVPFPRFGLTIDNDKVTKYGQKLKKLYFGDKNISMETLYQYFVYCSDLHFWHGIHQAVQSRINSDSQGKTFLYRFDLNTNLNVMKKLMQMDFDEAFHADDLMYCFNASLQGLSLLPELDSIEFEKMKMMITILTNFAIKGDPNFADSAWVPVSKSKNPVQCFNLTNDGSNMIQLPESERLKLWNEMFAELSMTPKHIHAKM